MFRTIAPKIADRPGGYTRILKTGFRLGDGADMCIIEFVDFNEAYTLGVAPAAAAAEAKPKTRRSRAKKTDAVEDATVVAEKKATKKAAALKAAAAKAAAPKVAKKTNVGKKM